MNNYTDFINQCIESNGKPVSLTGMGKAGYQVHHIKPFSEGGADEVANLVYLTPAEHLRAHELLARLYGGMYAHTFVSMASNPQYPATELQRWIASTMAKGLYKDPEIVRIFKEGRDKQQKRRKYKPARKQSGRVTATGFKGVYPQPSSKKNPFSTYMQLDGDRIRIGNYPTAEKAALAYDIASIQIDSTKPRNFPSLTLSELRLMILEF